MVQFYKQYFAPSSSTRARLSVHMHARGAGEVDVKIIDVLQSAGLEDVPQEKRQDLKLLGGYLADDLKLPESQREAIVSKAKELGLSHMPRGETAGAAMAEAGSAVDSAQEIKDVRQFKASLYASTGAMAVTDLCEFLETDAKL